jgi:hypothetical protein
MKRWIAAIGFALLFSGAAAGDPGAAPEVDAAATWASLEQKIDADLERKIDVHTERALRHHLANAEALRDVRGCDFATAPPEAGSVSASERHLRLTACLARRRAAEGLVAANPNPD